MLHGGHVILGQQGEQSLHPEKRAGQHAQIFGFSLILCHGPGKRKKKLTFLFNVTNSSDIRMTEGDLLRITESVCSIL